MLPQELTEGPDSIQPGIRRIGELVMRQRMRKNLSQSKLAAQLDCGRNTITHLEQGRRLPPPEDLEQIGLALDLIDNPAWRVVTHPEYLTTIRFQEALAELLGKSLSLDSLDPISQAMLIESVSLWIHPQGAQMSLTQAHDHFNALLTFYGERGVSLAFYQHFLGQRNFTSVPHFFQRVRAFQQTAIRIYGSFRKAFKTLSVCDEAQLNAALQSLQPVDPVIYTRRRPFTSIRSIARERLDDLGYISAERVKQQNRERHELHRSLLELASWIERSPDHSISGFSAKKLHRIQARLRKFESELQIEETLFSKVDPAEIRREALHLSPEDEDLARIAATQERGLQNLTAYLTEPYLDVYIATSMRERADFISVNTFVETLFSDPLIAPLHLRYFNPTLSWISDRVAKGLVEALMLRRASLTVYMAQKSDTFGKDSEASVALGQGKPVIVYVPRLYAPAYQLDSEALMQQNEGTLRQQLLALGTELDEDLDKQGLVGKLLSTRLSQLAPEALAEIIEAHWADFDLYGELKSLSPELSNRCNNWLDALTLRSADQPRPLPPLEICGVFIEKLVQVALFFERRSHTFKEIHPLALQVILSSGVLNGILVVRSAQACTRMVYQLLTNTLETELKVDPENYRLIEKHTGSTLRVISRHQLLTNAFWTQYFS
ncbi:MAG: helix-turn-helix transcriptional regulator [Candidatus Sericytochromatia bacterium]|nr:helix-turn-helix transcriptional regulator [Candidatus Sericytochromatia bacterium]